MAPVISKINLARLLCSVILVLGLLVFVPACLPFWPRIKLETHISNATEKAAPSIAHADRP